MSLLQTRSSTPSGIDEAPSAPRPVLGLAAAGGILIAFEIYVLARWVSGPNLRPTPTGPDPIPAARLVLQIAVPIGTVVCFWFWIVRPWIRAGRMTTDVMFVVAGAALFFWDMCMNYTSVTLFYNSHLLNFGAWANGAWPGWTSPGGNLLPEPVLIVVPAYTCLVFSQVMAVLWMLRKVKARRTSGCSPPSASSSSASRSRTPSSRASCCGPAVKFAAVFGAVHLSFALLYMVPNQWLATHSDPFPAGYPSYMVNGMCASGGHGDQCPGPGVPLPRP